MEFEESKLRGAYLVTLNCIEDSRGFYARAWCENEAKENCLVSNFVQHNISFTNKAGTLRGLHYQEAPYSETKLIRCTKGKIYDVIIDLRAGSSTYGLWEGFYLSPRNRKALYVPEGFANGFIAAEDETEIFYGVSEFYQPGYEKGIRFDDPVFSIKWPIPVVEVSEKDSKWPDFLLNKKIEYS